MRAWSRRCFLGNGLKLSRKSLLSVTVALAVFIKVGAFSTDFSYARQVEKTSVHIGVFNSEEEARGFYESLPSHIKDRIATDSLWLDVYKTHRGFIEHQINIDDVSSEHARLLCENIQRLKVQCLVTGSKPFLPVEQNVDVADVQTNEADSDLTFIPRPDKKPNLLRPMGLRIAYDVPEAEADALKAEISDDVEIQPTLQQDLQHYGDQFSTAFAQGDSGLVHNTPYAEARDRLLVALQAIDEDEGIDGLSAAAKTEIQKLGRVAFEAAGEAYFSGFLNRYDAPKEALSPDARAGKAFVHHVSQNLSESVDQTVDALVSNAFGQISSGGGIDSDLLTQSADQLFMAGARGFIDAGLATARRSDLYALRHLELEYNINDFENAYFSALITQPVYQSADLRHNVFFQGGGVINERSVDVEENDRNRHTVNLGAAYRYLTPDEKYLIGGNVFVDHQWPYDHARMSVGADVRMDDLNFATNYYQPLTGFQESRTEDNGLQYEERALRGYDVEVGYKPKFDRNLEVFGKGYHYWRTNGEKDLRGVEIGAEYKIAEHFKIKGAVIEENGGRDGAELTLQYYTPLYDEEEANLALADMPEDSLRSHIFDKVRRENRLRIEERLQPGSEPIVVDGPAFASSSPADDATGVSIGTDVTLTFGADVLAGAGDIVFTDLTDGTGNFTVAVNDARVGITNNVVTLDLSAMLLEFNTNYQVTFARGVFMDAAGNDSPALNAGDLNFNTVVNPIAGFPAATTTRSPNTTGSAFTPRGLTATWQTTVNVTGAPDGVIFESGANGRGIAASFGSGSLVFAAGTGNVSSTTGGAIFGSFPIASIPQGLHHFVFVAKPTAPAEIGVYMDGIRIIDESTVAAMGANEWAGTDNSGYGLTGSGLRSGVDTSPLGGVTLTNNLSFYSNQQPADF